MHCLILPPLQHHHLILDINGPVLLQMLGKIKSFESQVLHGINLILKQYYSDAKSS